MKFKIALYGISILTSFILVLILLTSHVADGNVFGIYITDTTLHIGDFWGGSLIVYLLFYIIPKRMDKLDSLIQESLDKELKKLKEELNENN